MENDMDVENPNYSMYTPEGNKAVAKRVRTAVKAIRYGFVTDIDAILKMTEAIFTSVEKIHPEVHDTEPREMIHQMILTASAQHAGIPSETLWHRF
jgi:hypothetical protein